MRLHHGESTLTIDLVLRIIIMIELMANGVNCSCMCFATTSSSCTNTMCSGYPIHCGCTQNGCTRIMTCDPNLVQSSCLACDGLYSSNSPTRSPTRSPTKQPTGMPTIITLDPTVSPTRIPTKQPTRSPMNQPTPQITNAPTLNVIINPTRAPTIAPGFTSSPTSRPTVTPFDPNNEICSDNYFACVGDDCQICPSFCELISHFDPAGNLQTSCRAKTHSFSCSGSSTCTSKCCTRISKTMIPTQSPTLVPTSTTSDLGVNSSCQMSPSILLLVSLLLFV